MSAKTYDRQSGKLIARIAENLPELTDNVMQGWIDNPKGLQKFLLGLNSPAPIPKSEAMIDPIIRVDRSVKPSYPDWMKKVLYPELEKVGPVEYDASTIKQWLHDGQKDGNWTTGHKIYAKLQEEDNKLLKTCLGLRDLEEIQKKGIAFFRKYFKGKAVFGWASVVQNRDVNLNVPCLYELGVKVVLDWFWLGNSWHGNYPALRHASSSQT